MKLVCTLHEYMQPYNTFHVEKRDTFCSGFSKQIKKSFISISCYETPFLSSNVRCIFSFHFISFRMFVILVTREKFTDRLAFFEENQRRTDV